LSIVVGYRREDLQDLGKSIIGIGNFDKRHTATL
jgi:hypothetical protein